MNFDVRLSSCSQVRTSPSRLSMEMEQVADVFGHPIASPPSPFFFLALRNECCDATLLLQESFASVLQGDYSAVAIQEAGPRAWNT